jgi:hypothetical protein
MEKFFFHIIKLEKEGKVCAKKSISNKYLEISRILNVIE